LVAAGLAGLLPVFYYMPDGRLTARRIGVVSADYFDLFFFGRFSNMIFCFYFAVSLFNAFFKNKMKYITLYTGKQ